MVRIGSILSSEIESIFRSYATDWLGNSATPGKRRYASVITRREVWQDGGTGRGGTVWGLGSLM